MSTLNEISKQMHECLKLLFDKSEKVMPSHNAVVLKSLGGTLSCYNKFLEQNSNLTKNDATIVMQDFIVLKAISNNFGSQILKGADGNFPPAVALLFHPSAVYRADLVLSESWAKDIMTELWHLKYRPSVRTIPSMAGMSLAKMANLPWERLNELAKSNQAQENPALLRSLQDQLTYLNNEYKELEHVVSEREDAKKPPEDPEIANVDALLGQIASIREMLDRLENGPEPDPEQDNKVGKCSNCVKDLTVMKFESQPEAKEALSAFSEAKRQELYLRKNNVQKTDVDSVWFGELREALDGIEKDLKSTKRRLVAQDKVTNAEPLEPEEREATSQDEAVEVSEKQQELSQKSDVALGKDIDKATSADIKRFEDFVDSKEEETPGVMQFTGPLRKRVATFQNITPNASPSEAQKYLDHAKSKRTPKTKV